VPRVNLFCFCDLPISKMERTPPRPNKLRVEFFDLEIDPY
jgi:hypothetical protein